MKNIPINLDRLSKEDIFSVATALLYTLKETPQYSTMSELFYILDYDNFLKLIKYFGGETIRIPSDKEVSETLKLLLLYQYREIEGLSWEESMSKSGIPKGESSSVKGKLVVLSKLLKELDLGKRTYE